MEAKKVLLILIIVVFVIITGLIAYVYIGKEKPDPVSVQCAAACESGQKTAFCLVEMTLKNDLTATCDELSKDSQYLSYNVQACPSISCTISAQEADKTCVTGLGSVWKTPNEGGICPSEEGKFARKRTASDSPPIEGQICCYYYE